MAIIIRGRKEKDRAETGFFPDSYFEQYGPDTAIVNTDECPPHIVTFSDLGRRKKERQADNLERKRETIETSIRPSYVWVFHCPGIGICYRGWWTYLNWRGGDSGKYLNRDEKTIRQLMEMFPMSEASLFGPTLTHKEWQIRFAKAYCCRHPDGTPRKHAGRIQGKALLWAEFYGERFQRIIGRAYLPRQRAEAEGIATGVQDEG